jgi:hypothetical protein
VPRIAAGSGWRGIPRTTLSSRKATGG